MTLYAGDLDRRIDLLQPQAVDDGFSSDPGSFEVQGGRWSKKTDVSDSEQIAAAAQGRAVTSRFVVRWDSLTSIVTGAWRLRCEGTTYEIVGIKEVMGRRVAIEITAKAARL